MNEFVAMPAITALYAGLLGLMSIAIAFMAGRLRGGPDGVSIGDGGKIEVITAMRRHANFVETVPLALLLLALLELNRIPSTAIHALGATLFVARACHAVGFGAEGALGSLRAVGSLGSVVVILVASIWAISTF